MLEIMPRKTPVPQTSKAKVPPEMPTDRHSIIRVARRDGTRRTDLIPYESLIKFDDDGRKRVLTFIRENGWSLVLMARVGGISTAALNHHLKNDEQFFEDCEHAKAEFVKGLEAEAYRRAVTGLLENVYNKDGDIVGQKKVYSDRLLEILLKANDPAKFREQHHLNIGTGGPGGVLIVPQKMTQEEAIQQLKDLTKSQEDERDARMRDITPDGSRT